MPTASHRSSTDLIHGDGWWRAALPAAWRMTAGIVDRTGNASAIRRACGTEHLAWAQQVHGAGLALISSRSGSDQTIPGCDALLTAAPGLALVIRTADCLPILVADPVRRVVAATHAGWRGLSAELPLRLVRGLTELSSSLSRNLWVWIGPCIRACCYEVGGEFRARFGAFVQERKGRLWCDLPAAAAAQLQLAGVPAARIVDTGLCTGCDRAGHPAAGGVGDGSAGARSATADLSRWYSVRREGQQTGRLLSFIALQYDRLATL